MQRELLVEGLAELWAFDSRNLCMEAASGGKGQGRIGACPRPSVHLLDATLSDAYGSERTPLPLWPSKRTSALCDTFPGLKKVACSLICPNAASSCPPARYDYIPALSVRSDHASGLSFLISGVRTMSAPPASCMMAAPAPPFCQAQDEFVQRQERPPGH